MWQFCPGNGQEKTSLAKYSFWNKSLMWKFCYLMSPPFWKYNNHSPPTRQSPNPYALKPGLRAPTSIRPSQTKALEIIDTAAITLGLSFYWGNKTIVYTNNGLTTVYLCHDIIAQERSKPKLYFPVFLDFPDLRFWNGSHAFSQ